MEPTEYRHPLDPTQAAYYNLPGPYDSIPLPPPPRKEPVRVRLTHVIILAVLFLLVLSIGATFFVVYGAKSSLMTQPTMTGSPTPIQTMNSNYTADDILKAMQNAGCSCGAELSQNVSLDDFLGPSFKATVLPTSQLAWSDPVQQFYNVGLWVYADNETALNIYGQVGTYEVSSGTSVTALKIDHVHGRCLFLISGGTWGTPWAAISK